MIVVCNVLVIVEVVVLVEWVGVDVSLVVLVLVGGFVDLKLL